MEDITKKYDNGDITVVWEPGICAHSAICFHGLPTVFNPANRPWITIDAEDTDIVMDQIDKCPSGALSYYRNI